MNNIFDKISPFLSLGMLTVFVVFVVTGALFGMGRGVKRAGLRLIIFVGLLVVAFFVTPLIVNGVLHVNLKIAGYTPEEAVAYGSEQLVKFLQQNLGDYIVPFQAYIKDYALGIMLAFLNLAVFYALYFVVKFVGLIIYAIMAHYMAPKRTKDGKKLPKHAGWGALVGALQGVLLFVIFLFPINGLVGIVNHAGEYASQQADSAQVHAQATVAVDTDELSSSISSSINSVDKAQVAAFMQKMDGPLKVYNNFIKYSGIQFFSNQALEYQLTVRVENATDINLVQDLNNGLELVVDAQDVMTVMKKFQHAYQDGKLDLTSLTPNDYQILRNFINKAFDLQILNVANQILGDMDQIFRTPFNDNLDKLEGTDIYVNSIYGLLIKNNTTDRDLSATLAAGETNYTKYAAGLQAAVQYIGEQKLDLVRKDLINIIDFMETLNIYQVSYNGLAEPDTMTNLLAQGGLGAQDYFDLSTARLTNDYGQYQQGEYLIYVLGNRLSKFATVQMVGLKNVDNLLTYGKVMDNSFTNDAALKTLVDELIPMFIGESALTHYDEHNHRIQGYWETLGKDIVDVAHVLRDYVTIADDINREKTRLIDEGTAVDRAQVQAVLNYMEKLVITQAEYNATKDTNPDFIGKTYDEIKFQKIDRLVDALYQLVDDFPPVKNYARTKLQSMANADGGEYIQMLLDMLDLPKAEWKKTLQEIVNVANIINHSKLGELIGKVQSDPAGLAEDLINSVAELSVTDVQDMIESVLAVPGIGDTVQDTLDKALHDMQATGNNELKELLGGEGNTITDEQISTVRGKATAVQNALDTLQSDAYEHMTDEEKAAAEKALSTSMGALWQEIQNYQIPGLGA